MKIASVAAVIVFSLIGRAQDPRSERVIQALNELTAAMLQGNYARAVDLTHPKVLQVFGGREKTIAAFKSGAESTHAETGLVPIGEKAEPPLGFWVGGSDVFTIVPVTGEGKLRGGKVVWKAHYIGISSDQGKSWVFVNGLVFQNGKAPSPKDFFPNWPPALQLPTRERGRFEPN